MARFAGAPLFQPSADHRVANRVCYVKPAMSAETPEVRSLSAEMLDHIDALHHFARYLTRDAAAAEDLVQEAFTRCLAAAGRFTRGTNLRAWMLRVLRNAFIDVYRRERANPARGGLDAAFASADDVSGGELLRDDLEVDRLRGLVAEDIERALLSLSDDARMVVLLDLEGLTEAEIAEVMDSAVGTVKSRLFRARAALREKLREYAR
jgi:RNA polymerase sigma-70 factor (ECF subfamily)